MHPLTYRSHRLVRVRGCDARNLTPSYCLLVCCLVARLEFVPKTYEPPPEDVIRLWELHLGQQVNSVFSDEDEVNSSLVVEEDYLAGGPHIRGPYLPSFQQMWGFCPKLESRLSRD